MSNLPEARNDIEIEDVRFRSAVSEAVQTKMGESINFINRRQDDSHSFNLNGPYKLGEGSTGTDGVHVFRVDVEVTGFEYYSNVGGLSGSTIIDIHRLTGGDTDAGTIFSTRPEVDSTAADGTYTARDLVNSTTLSNPTGHTLAVLSVTQFNAGDAIRLDLDQAMSGADGFSFKLLFRPR